MTFPSNMDLTVFIDGVEFTDYVEPDSIKIKWALTNLVDTFKCRIIDPPSTPVDWQELTVYDGVDKIFGGYIQSFKDAVGDDLGLDYNLSASDYSIRFGHVTIKEQYTDATNKEMIADIFSKYMPGEGFDGVTYVEAVKRHDKKRFNRKKLLDVLKELAKDAGCDWRVDVDKKLHFFKNEKNYAPFNVSDNPDYVTTMPYSKDVVDTDGSGVINRVEVVGSTYLSDDSTFNLPGTGVDNRIIIPFRFHAPDGHTSVLMYRNDGTLGSPVWTPLTVKIAYIDELVNPNDLLYYFTEKVIEQATPFPALQNAVKIVGKYDVPLRVRVVDNNSFAFYGGRYFDDTVNRTDLNSKMAAKIVAKTKLAENALSKKVISFETRQPGLHDGQIIKFTSALRGIDNYFLIQTVTGNVGIDGKSVFTVDVGIYNHTLIDLLIILNRQMNAETVWRDDEVLDEILQTAETLELEETHSLSTSQAPYYFSHDPAISFVWGFGAFTP